MYVYKYIYIYIYPSQSTQDTSILQLLPVLRWHVRQLQAPLRRCAHKHFNALGGIHIFAGIVNCAVGATWFLPVGHFWPTSFYLRGRDLFHCSLRGGTHTSAPHWTYAWASPNMQVAFEKQGHTIYGQDKGPIYSLLSYRRVYTPSGILLNSVTSEASAFYLCPS